MIRYAKLNIAADLHRLQEETERMLHDASWRLHFNTYQYQGNWEVLPLRSPGGRQESIFADLMRENAFEDTPLMSAFPSVRHLLTQLECPVMSVRLLNLRTGAVVSPHKDHGLCYEQGEARLHIPVFTNERVRFYVDDMLVKMEEGTCWYINANRKHSVSNEGTTDRIHLVIDCTVNEWLQSVFDAGEKTCVEDTGDRERTLQMIAALRLQQTDTALQMAAELEQALNNNNSRHFS